MKLYGVTVSAPREDDRYFAVLADSEDEARNMAVDCVDYELCSIVVSLLSNMLHNRFNNCVEIGA